MKFTLSTITSGRIPHVLGVCSTDTRLIQWANAAQERLLNCGRWYGTVVRARFCVDDGCLTWPREVATVEKVNLCSDTILSRNVWYEFTEFINPYCTDCTCNNDPRLIAMSNAPTIADIDTDGRNVIAYATNVADEGVDIIVEGYDDNNAWVRTDDGGTPLDGERITLTVAGTVSTTIFTQITGIKKEESDYDVLLYQYNATTAAVEQLLGRYQPTELYPDYRRSNLKDISQGCCCNTDEDDPTYTVEAIVSLQHIPVAGPNDWFIIQNQTALELAMQGIKLEEDGDDVAAEAKFKKATRELQRQHEKYWPSTQATIRTSGFGTAHPARLFDGFI